MRHTGAWIDDMVAHLFEHTKFHVTACRGNSMSWTPRTVSESRTQKTINQSHTIGVKAMSTPLGFLVQEHDAAGHTGSMQLVSFKLAGKLTGSRSPRSGRSSWSVRSRTSPKRPPTSED